MKIKGPDPINRGSDPAQFDRILNGKQVRLFTLINSNGVTCDITNYGARVVSLWVPDRNGQFDDIVLGFDSIEGYLNSSEAYFGATIGRYANRITKGRFKLGKKVYQLDCNDGENHIHGGKDGFHNQVWEAEQVSPGELELSYVSRDGEEGYPGNLHVRVRYSLDEDNTLSISYSAQTDADTPFNITNHSYFNLKGAGNGNVGDHILQINASQFTPLQEGQMPEGAIESVENSPFDFRKPTRINSRIEEGNEQLQYGSGYDHHYVLDNNGADMAKAASVEEEKSGRVLDVYTSEPGIQFYGGNFLDGSVTGKNNKVYAFRSAFCLETQQFPDSMNHRQFPTSILRAGETYTSITRYRFGVNYEVRVGGKDMLEM